MPIGSNQMSPKFIIFDLDDTLIGSEQIYDQLYEKLLIDRPLFEEARLAVKLQLGQGHVAARNRLLYFKKYLELQNNFSANSLLNLNANYENLLRELLAKELAQNHHVDLLLTLKQKFRLGLVTNENTRTQMIKLLQIDPKGEIFEFILTSEEIGFEKPHPTIVQKAISLTQTPPGEILMIGDSINNDLEPFRKAGCMTIGTTQFRDESGNKKEFNWIKSLSELKIE